MIQKNVNPPSNYNNCTDNPTGPNKTCRDGPATCPPGTIGPDANGRCAITAPATCPDNTPATGPTCTVTTTINEPATCTTGTTGPDAIGRCTGTEIGTKQCVNPTSTGICQTNPQF